MIHDLVSHKIYPEIDMLKLKIFGHHLTAEYRCLFLTRNFTFFFGLNFESKIKTYHPPSRKVKFWTSKHL